MRLTRRGLLKAGGVAAGAIAVGGPLAACGSSTPAPRRERVAIVGAGLAGLACAYRLRELGIDAAVFEARPDRVGGRCYSARGFADGQVAEFGGEFIDTDHRRLRKLVPELGLELEDRDPAARAQRQRGLHGKRLFDDELLTVDQIYRDYPEFKANLRATGRQTGYYRNYGYSGTEASRFDRRTALSYLEEAVPGGAESKLGLALQTYLSSEFGLDAADLAATSVLYLLEGNAGDQDGSDERFHVAGGNDQIATRMADELNDGRLTMDAPLEALAKRDDGEYSLQVAGVGEVRAERVVLAVPFTTLRDVQLDDSGLSEGKLRAIRELGMGTNSKVILQFERRPGAYGSWNGALATDHPFQYTWDTSLTQDGRAGIVTVYSGGADGAELDAPDPLGTAPDAVVRETLAVLERVAPGISDGYAGEARVANWSEDPWSKGSYAAFEPGQTSTLGLAAKQQDGAVHFAGEHTSTAYQGFLEGAVESGERAAREVHAALAKPS